MGNKIVVVGGRTAAPSAEPVTPTEVFNGTGWQDYADIQVPGDHLAAASDGTYLYAVGGRRLEVTANTAAVQRFDPNTDRWTQLPVVPGKVSDCGVAIVGGRLIVVGGESAGTVFNTVRAYDLTASTWSTLPNLAAPRHGLAVAAIGNTLYAIDGAAEPGHNASTSTVQTLAVPRGPAQPAGGWQLGSNSLLAVQQVGAAVLDGRIWVAGGLTDAENATAKTEFYDPTVGTWSPGPDLPVPLHHAMMVSYQNTVWVIGGFEPRGSEVSGIASARVLHLNQAETAWVDGPAAPPCACRRRGGGGGEQDRRGRRADRGHFRRSRSRPPRFSTAPAGRTMPTFWFRAITWRPRRTGRTCTPSAGAGWRSPPIPRRCSASTRTLTGGPSCRSAPGTVSDCGVAIVGGRLIVVGGESVGTVFNTVRAYDLATSTWSTLPNLASPRHGLAVAAIGNTLYAIDGAAEPGHTASTNTVQTLAFHS